MMGEEAKICGGDVGSGIRIARSQPTIDVCLNLLLIMPNGRFMDLV